MKALVRTVATASALSLVALLSACATGPVANNGARLVAPEKIAAEDTQVSDTHPQLGAQLAAPEQPQQATQFRSDAAIRPAAAAR